MYTVAKRIGLLVLLAGIFSGSSMYAQTTSALQAFDEGNRAYLEGDYRGALEAYGRVQSNGYISGALFHNMGNAYYRLDENGQAVRYYEKALRLIPESREVNHNLQTVRTRLADRISPLPRPIWIRWWKSLVFWAGDTGLLLVGVFFYFVAAVLFGYRIWKRSRNPWLRRALFLSGSAGILFLTLSFIASADLHTTDAVVVIADRVEVRESPSTEAAANLEIHEGLVLDKLSTQDEWLRVRLPNGVEGWVETNTTAEI